MEQVEYLGEHLWPGQLGHFAILFSFVAALLAIYSYFKAHREPENSGWRNLGRWAFMAHSAMTLLVIGLLFHIMLRKYYEYEYVWAHVSDDLPMRYLFSAFWEDQAGSFLLWAFWHIVLGIVLMRTSGIWESPVMATLSAIQAFIISMLLGIYLWPENESLKLGFNPFMLLRETTDIPLFNNADYLKQLTGKGLNPLLQNYWMTIHPPTLFLGFASTAVPFCFAVAGLWKRQYTAWLRPALPWALFSAAILGIGILMGAAWAYEALSFGGYWAWDPVENMSLVPWLLLVAGIHTNLIAKHKGHSIRTTIAFYALTFLLVLYSTFLTRSGVLQDSSVHAFTEMGLEWQLVAFILFFGLWALWPFLKNYRLIPTRSEEEPFMSREYWMFFGSLVLLFSAVLISFTTSIPVYNKLADILGIILGKDMAQHHRSMPLEPVEHYNKYQFWIALLIASLSGVAQHLRYNAGISDARRGPFLIRIGSLLLSSVVLTWITWLWLDYQGWAHHLLVGCAWFTISANTDYLISSFRGNARQGASTLSHIGFGLMIVGIVASGLKKQHISQNRYAMEGILSEDIVTKNVLLFRDAPLLINGYRVTYLSDSIEGTIRTYELEFEKINAEGVVSESFRLYPNIQYDREFQKQAASNPSTKRYLFRDIFTHIAGIPPEHGDVEKAKAKEDSLRYNPWSLLVSDTSSLEKHQARLLSWSTTTDHPDYNPEEGDLCLTARIGFWDEESDTVLTCSPSIVLRENLIYTYPARIDALGIKARLSEKVFDGYLAPESDLEYQIFEVAQKDSVQFQGYTIYHTGYDRTPDHPLYRSESEDIAVSALLSIKEQGQGFSEELSPVFLIRDSQPYNLKSYSPASGIHARFAKLDPNSGTITLMLAKQKGHDGLPVEVAENFEREDYVVLEAIIFPGINMFWLGSLLMMVGLAISAGNRMKIKTVS